MAKDVQTLANVAEKSKALREARVTLRMEAEAWIERKLEEYNQELELAVVTAAEDEHSVANIARSYTVSGKTPNRNAIYVILAKHKDQPMTVDDYPFEWVPRRVRRATGTKTVYDVHAALVDFGPDHVTGDFVWRYDEPTQELDEQLGVEDPYPITTKYYDQVLSRWMHTNPYPGGE